MCRIMSAGTAPLAAQREIHWEDWRKHFFSERPLRDLRAFGACVVSRGPCATQWLSLLASSRSAPRRPRRQPLAGVHNDRVIAAGATMRRADGAPTQIPKTRRPRSLFPWLRASPVLAPIANDATGPRSDSPPSCSAAGKTCRRGAASARSGAAPSSPPSLVRRWGPAGTAPWAAQKKPLRGWARTLLFGTTTSGPSGFRGLRG
jgi:hypothetical protein